MKLEDLVEMSADELEKLSDAQLLEFFKPMLEVTRPDRARANKPKDTQPSLPFMPPTKKAAVNALKDLGIDLDFMGQKGKKRFK